MGPDVTSDSERAARAPAIIAAWRERAQPREQPDAMQVTGPVAQSSRLSGSVRHDDGSAWPDVQAERVVAAVLAAQDGAGAAIEDAARHWAGSHTSTVLMIQRLGILDEVLPRIAGDVGHSAHNANSAHNVNDANSAHNALKKLTELAVRFNVEDLASAAMTDALTGVGNRRAMREALDAASELRRASGNEFSIVMIDLDGLKAINDRQGHAAGDRALVALARSVRDALGDGEKMFRVGGDEFVVLLTETPASAIPGLMTQAAASGAPAFSWGVATSGGEGGKLLETGTLLAGADLDLYERRARRPDRARPASAPRPKVVTLGAERRPRTAWVAATAAFVALGIAVGLHAMPQRNEPAAARPVAPASGRRSAAGDQRGSQGARLRSCCAQTGTPGASGSYATVPASGAGGERGGTPRQAGAATSGILTSSTAQRPSPSGPGTPSVAPVPSSSPQVPPLSPGSPPRAGWLGSLVPVISLSPPPAPPGQPPGATTLGIPGASVTLPPA